MTEKPVGGSRPAIARNLAAVRRRLGRVRVPATAASAWPRRRVVVIGGGVAAVLVVLFLLTLDLHSVAWWETLSKSERRAFDFVTRFGKSDWLLIPTGVVSLAVLFADWSRTDRRVAAAWIEFGNLTAFFFFSVAFAGIVTNLIKWTLGRSRPALFAEDGAYKLSFLSFDYAHVSFPSGHSTTVAAALVALALIFRGRRVMIAIVGIAAATIAVSRIGVRAHFPSDVVAGLFVGSAFTWLYAQALGRHGVAFQVQPDGSLRPQSVALRRTLARSGGAAAMARGFGRAFFGAGGNAAVEKR